MGYHDPTAADLEGLLEESFEVTLPVVAPEREALPVEPTAGFEDVTDDIVYSHEVGLVKPDPAAYALVTRRLRVEAGEVLFLDDVEANVVAARALGWHAVLHRDTASSIAEMERIIEAAADV